MQLAAQVDALTWDKENMVEQHTLETGELRKKITVLRETLESGPTVMPPHSNEFSDFTDDLDGLTMGTVTDWDNYGQWVDVSMDSDQPQQTPIKPQATETAVVLAQRQKEPFISSDSDKPAASGLLLMLLLYGAFVATRSSGSSTSIIPQMSDEVRAASATILDNVLKDAGANPAQQASIHASRAMTGVEPTPSVASWVQPADSKSHSLGDTIFSSNGNPSTLDSLSAQLMAPSKEQEAEAAFGMTPAQYNSYTTADFKRVYSTSSTDDDSATTPPSSTSGGRKNLAETLRIMRDEARGSTAAEVYTRSLLWDRIPSEVVHEFKRWVEESSSESKSGDSVD